MRPSTVFWLQEAAISLQNWMKLHIGFGVRQQLKQLAGSLIFLYEKIFIKNNSQPFFMFRSLNA